MLQIISKKRYIWILLISLFINPTFSFLNNNFSTKLKLNKSNFNYQKEENNFAGLSNHRLKKEFLTLILSVDRDRQVFLHENSPLLLDLKPEARIEEDNVENGNSKSSFASSLIEESQEPTVNPWSVLNNKEAEYTLNILNSIHPSSAILHFIEITYDYAKHNLNLTDLPSTQTSSNERYFNSGSCVQTKLSSFRNITFANYRKFSKQAEVALRTANLLTTILTDHSINPKILNPNPSNDKQKFSKRTDFDNDSLLENQHIELNKNFFWSLLKVNLQTDPDLFAIGIMFKSDSNEFPIKLKFNQKLEPNNSKASQSSAFTKKTKNQPFCPYIFRQNTKNEPTSSNNSSNKFSYVNLSAYDSLYSRIVPNSNSNENQPSTQLKDKINRVKILRYKLSNQKPVNPFSDSYAYTSDWYRIHEDYYASLSNQKLKHSKLPSIQDLVKTYFMFSSIEQGYWSLPYSDCSITKTWLVSYSVPFFGFSNKLNKSKIEFKGVVVISVNLALHDVNQCSDKDMFFPNSHKCDQVSTECLPSKGFGFRRGGYVCQCKLNYYIRKFNMADSSLDTANQLQARHYFNGTTIESAFVSNQVGLSKTPHYPKHFMCTPCPKNCLDCTSNLNCKVIYSSSLRSMVLGVQSFCVTIVIILAATTFKLRRSKYFATSRWVLLEFILFGAILLYITVIIQYFEPKPFTCFIEPWFRELGFGFCYGAIVIKLYRIYAEFQTRKAHRVCVRDKDLLKYLAAIILVITGHMAAWTVLVLDSIHALSNFSDQSADIYILDSGTISNNHKFFLCKKLSWDYVTQLGEISFILIGIYLSYCIRNARSEFYREKYSLCLCIYIEFLGSGILYLLRLYSWNSLHPDYIYLMYFLRCQLTTSIVLILLFVPKIFYQHKPPTFTSNVRNRPRFFTDEQRARVPEAMRLHAAILSNGENDISDINLSEMDSEDIRSELRRVYTQLHILKNKTVRKDNPHISKRRGGRKGAHRRFSLQTFSHSKHMHKQPHSYEHSEHDHDHETNEISRTPEESTTSVEGPSVVYADGQSSILSRQT